MHEELRDLDLPTVYHGLPPGVPRLIAFCADGLAEQHYLPHALDDDIVYAWGLQRNGRIALYLLPGDEEVDVTEGRVMGPFRTLKAACATCAEEADEPLRVVVL